MSAISASRQIAELVRVHLNRHEQSVDDAALRELCSRQDSNGFPRTPLAECLRGQPRPRLTEEGARIVSELLSVWEEQT